MIANRPSPESNIRDLHRTILENIASVLNQNQNWRKVVQRLPSHYGRRRCINIIERKEVTNPGMELLVYLGNDWMTIAELSDILQETNLIDAKTLLLKYEPIQIIQGPPQTLLVNSGDEITLCCQAQGIPPPEYHWIKNEEQLNINGPELIISTAQVEDSGKYYCIVRHHNPLSEDEDYISSSSCNVTVKPLPDADMRNQPPEIVCQPRNPCNGKILRGSNITLKCEARSFLPITYKWYKDGKELPGEYDLKLELEDLQPDSNGNCKWEYVCQVENEYGSTLSDVVTIEMDSSSAEKRPKDKVALLVGNGNYEAFDNLTLTKPDVITLAKLLIPMEFTVLALLDLNLTEMRNIIHLFCESLDEDVHTLVYFAGHGFESDGCQYFLPTDATEFSPDQSISIQTFLLKEIQKRKPSLVTILLDVCRQPPEHPLPVTTKQVLQPVYMRNTIIGYATIAMTSALEVMGEENGVYMKHLKKFITQKKPVWDILSDVQRSVEQDSRIADRQSPCTFFGLSRRLTLADPIDVSEPTYRAAERWNDILADSRSIDIHIENIGVIVRISIDPGDGVLLNIMDLSFELIRQYYKPRCHDGEHTISLYLHTYGDRLTISAEKPSVVYQPAIRLQRLQQPLTVTLFVMHGQDVCYREELMINFPFIAKKHLWLNRVGS